MCAEIWYCYGRCFTVSSQMRLNSRGIKKRRSSKSVAAEEKMNSSAMWKTTAPDLIWRRRANYLKSFIGCTGQMNLREQALVSPFASELSTGMAAECGQKVKSMKAQHSIFHYLRGLTNWLLADYLPDDLYFPICQRFILRINVPLPFFVLLFSYPSNFEALFDWFLISALTKTGGYPFFSIL